jgi:NAD(P)-dependent dehydrogenase (short-subunit alcohol dehydrogenase family)
VAGLVEGKVALVTGGSKGIGRDTALLFAEEGASAVVVADLDDTGGEEAAELVRKQGAESVYVRADVSERSGVERVMQETLSHYDRLDCAYNNAGIIGAHLPLHEWTDEMFDRVNGVNYRGVFLCMRSQIQHMMGREGTQSIVNASSGAGLNGVRGMSVYTASKHAVAGLTKAAALEYRTLGVRVNSVCPGGTNTTLGTTERRSPWLADNLGDAMRSRGVGRRGEPRDIAEAVVWLSSDRADYVNGTVFAVDNGWAAG